MVFSREYQAVVYIAPVAFYFIIRGDHLKKLALSIVSVCMSYQAIAAVDPIILAVEKNLNALFSDTVNEGDTTAEVLRIKGEPQIKCSKLIYSKGRRMVFCFAEIKTSYGKGLKEHGQASCNSLGFILDKKGQVEDRYSSESTQKCLESIYDASYN